MSHMKGIEPNEAGWFTRLVYWFVRRKFGKLTGKDRLIEPVKVSIVCVHLVEGTSRAWLPVPSSSDEVEYDWLCPACNPENPDVELLKAICIHCVRKLRAIYDPNYEDDDDRNDETRRP